jgi:NitT/TauT family transport system permease protein
VSKPRDPALLAALLAGIVSVALSIDGAGWAWPQMPLAACGWLATLAALVWLLVRNRSGWFGPSASALLGAVAVLALADAAPDGTEAAALWPAMLAVLLLAWRGIERLAARPSVNPLAVPALFGFWVLWLWQAGTVGAAVPAVLLPPPSAIATTLLGALPLLGGDVVQTVLRAVVPGYLIGCGAGLLVGLLADRADFLRRGLLPVGNLVSALPMVGVAPIMVMWFGFDWQSKAAVVALMTFFPMLVNVLAGLAVLGRHERDLMRTYAAGHWQTLRVARLPAALPFIFAALKLNSTLALIGAIVAEFFGAPTQGLGFRISSGIGRMDLALVWAAIVVSAASGSVAFLAIAGAEGVLTFWHPSQRVRDASTPIRRVG